MQFRIRHSGRLFLLGVGSFLILSPILGQSGQLDHHEHMGSSMGIYNARSSEPLKVSFNGKSESWIPATLAELPHITLKVHNEHTKADESYSGVDLDVLLERLEVPLLLHGNALRLYIVAEGADGYKAVLSLAEATTAFHDEQVIVADSRDGKPIVDSGPLQLIVTGDKRPARWVHGLVGLRVLTAD